MNETTDAITVLAPFWRFKWLILLVGLLVAGGTYLHYDKGASTYTSSTQVNLAYGAEQQGITPSAEPTKKRGGARKQAASTPSAIASGVINSPIIHQTVVARLRAAHGANAEAALRGSAAARGGENPEIVTISGSASTGPASALLANTTADTFVGHENADYVLGVRTALAATRSQLNAVELALIANPNAGASRGRRGKKGAEGASKTSDILQAASLKSKLTQLEAQQGITNVRQLGLANGQLAQATTTDPKQNAIFGFVIGLFLASVAAYTLNAFDRRVRTLAGIESVFPAQLLAALPSVRQPLVRHDGQVKPAKALNEPLRRLQTVLRLGEALNGRRGGPRSILFLSPDAADGKSTVAAGLALVQRDAGERVSLIEADFRRPVQARMLGTALTGGLLEVLAGSLTPEEAMQTVGPAPGEPHELDQGGPASVVTVLNSRSTGSLSVLLGDRGVANPPALLAEPAMAVLVRSSAEEFDHVLIDAPPPLMVSDAMPLLAVVDGIVLVARMGHTREASAKRLVQLLAGTPSAPIIGVVANDVSRADLKRYGFSPGYPRRGLLAGLRSR